MPGKRFKAEQIVNKLRQADHDTRLSVMTA
jgi:hypothetical protein